MKKKPITLPRIVANTEFDAEHKQRGAILCMNIYLDGPELVVYPQIRFAVAYAEAISSMQSENLELRKALAEIKKAAIAGQWSLGTDGYIKVPDPQQALRDITITVRAVLKEEKQDV